ncbi:unnamed protein product, partial [Iphiclides podalirius]
MARAVDASGRYQPGFFQGNKLWLGSKDLCFRLDNEYKAKGPQYNADAFIRSEKDFDEPTPEWPVLSKKEPSQSTQADVDMPQHRLEYVAVQILLNITKFKVPKTYGITLGLCLPRSCAPEDVLSLINFSVMLNDNLKSNGTTPRSVKVTSLRLVEEYYDMRYDPGAVLVFLATMLLATLAMLATIVDVGLINCLKRRSGSLSVNVQKFNEAGSIRYGEECGKLNREVVKVFVDLKKERTVDNETLPSKKEGARMLKVEAMKQAKQNETTPTITLGVMTSERKIASCNRCGKYRKQCDPKVADNLPERPPIQYKTCATLTNTEYRKRDSIYLNLLLSFSLKHNWKRIFNTKMANKDLAVVHLLRIFATFWVIFVHVTVLVDYLSGDNGKNNGTNSRYHVLNMGTLAFDTLFFSRLLPPYMYMVFVTAALSRVWRDTAATAFPEKDYDNCDAYWWRNLFYISLFYPRDEQCMQISWYLSTETALHVCGALICVVLTLRRRVALLALNATLLAAVATDVLKAFTDYHNRFNGVFGAYASLMNRPVARVAPYFMGILAGWLVHVVDGRTRVCRVTSCCLWLASVGALVTSLVTSSLYSHWGSAWLHLCWPAALLWPAIACATDHAGEFP